MKLNKKEKYIINQINDKKEIIGTYQKSFTSYNKAKEYLLASDATVMFQNFADCFFNGFFACKIQKRK